jgi:hypothetical protein
MWRKIQRINVEDQWTGNRSHWRVTSRNTSMEILKMVGG